MKLNPIHLIRVLRRRFYDGPALFNYPGRQMKGYKSPNLLIYYWLYAQAATRFSFAGLLLLLLSAVVVMVSATAILMPAFLLAALLGGLFTVDFMVGWFLRPRLKVARTVPESAPAHSRIRIDYRVQNLRHRPLWHIYIDATPLPQGLRNADGRAYLDTLDGDAAETATAYVIADRRGEYLLPMPVADSAFPFGLWRWGSYGPPNRPVIVYPEYTPLTQVDIPVGARYQSGIMKADINAGNAAEFHGTREYRYGDNPRHIHALTSARLREPIIKEFREEYLTRVAILVDTYPRPIPRWLQAIRPDNPNFEAALSLTAAITEYLVRIDYRIDFFALGKPPLRGGGGRGTSYLQTILNLLAGIKISEGDWPGIPDDLVQEMSQISAATVVLLKWDADRAQLVDDLRNAGIGTRVFVISDRPVELPADPSFTHLTPDLVLKGNVTEI